MAQTGSHIHRGVKTRSIYSKISSEFSAARHTDVATSKLVGAAAQGVKARDNHPAPTGHARNSLLQQSVSIQIPTQE